jgi:hypothetical protein
MNTKIVRPQPPFNFNPFWHQHLCLKKLFEIQLNKKMQIVSIPFVDRVLCVETFAIHTKILLITSGLWHTSFFLMV